MTRRVIATAMIMLLAGGLAAPASAQTSATDSGHAAPYCGITWGSLPKSGGKLSQDPLTNVRGGQHRCFDRLVVDIRGPSNGFRVEYVAVVHDQGGQAIPLRGGAFLQIDLTNPAYDPQTGQPTYHPANPKEIVNVSGWRTFRQVAYGGTFEGYSTIGLGVRARLPFRVFSLDGPGGGSRVVIDVANKW